MVLNPSIDTLNRSCGPQCSFVCFGIAADYPGNHGNYQIYWPGANQRPHETGFPIPRWDWSLNEDMNASKEPSKPD
jgi:hypothetical protein